MVVNKEIIAVNKEIIVVNKEINMKSARSIAAVLFAHSLALSYY